MRRNRARLSVVAGDRQGGAERPLGLASHWLGHQHQVRRPSSQKSRKPARSKWAGGRGGSSDPESGEQVWQPADGGEALSAEAWNEAVVEEPTEEASDEPAEAVADEPAVAVADEAAEETADTEAEEIADDSAESDEDQAEPEADPVWAPIRFAPASDADRDLRHPICSECRCPAESSLSTEDRDGEHGWVLRTPAWLVWHRPLSPGHSE